MKVITVVGARPQFIKAAVVSRTIAQHNRQDPTEQGAPATGFPNTAERGS